MDWTLNDALALVRALQPKTRDFSYHLALGGGVLNTGKSKKDVDLYFLPLDNNGKPSDAKGLVAWLTKEWGQPETLGGNYGEPEEIEQRPTSWEERARTWRSRIRRMPPSAGTWVLDNNVNSNMVYLSTTDEVAKTPKPVKAKAYAYKLKFTRTIDNARIDVFVV